MHYITIPQLGTWVSQRLRRKCEADSIGQDNVEMLRIDVKPAMEAHTVAELFVYNFVCRVEAPDYLHTEQGRNFE